MSSLGTKVSCYELPQWDSLVPVVPAILEDFKSRQPEPQRALALRRSVPPFIGCGAVDRHLASSGRARNSVRLDSSEVVLSRRRPPFGQLSREPCRAPLTRTPSCRNSPSLERDHAQPPSRHALSQEDAGLSDGRLGPRRLWTQLRDRCDRELALPRIATLAQSPRRQQQNLVHGLVPSRP